MEGVNLCNERDDPPRVTRKKGQHALRQVELQWRVGLGIRGIETSHFKDFAEN